MTTENDNTGQRHATNGQPLDFVVFKPNPVERRRWKKGKEPCAYCGGAASTREHVVPKNLYIPEDRKALQLQTIPACKKCNGDKALVDETLLYYLSADIDSSQHEKAKPLLLGPTSRAAARNQVRMLDKFYDGKTVPSFTRDGDYDAPAWAVEIDFDPVYKAVEWITRGMHWLVFKEIPEISTLGVYVVDRYQRKDVMVKSLSAGGFQAHFKQGEQYGCTWGETPSGVMYWYHVFFDSVLFVARSHRSFKPD
jgi:hypothetical protein